MENLFILGSPRTPTIDFNIINNYFIISGISSLSEADAFFLPIVRFLESYEREVEQTNIKQKNTNGIPITFLFKFKYFNSLSVRYLHSIVNIIEKLSNTNQVSLIWVSDSTDELNIEMANDFIDLFDIKIQLIIDEIPVRKKFTNKFKDVN